MRRAQSATRIVNALPRLRGETVLYRASLVVLLVVLGFWMRSLATEGVRLRQLGPWPWSTTAVTLYFGDGTSFVPVSRRMTAGENVPRLALEALLAGPRSSTGLATSVPPGVQIRSFEVAGDVVRVDVSREWLTGDTKIAAMALVATMTALSDVTAVTLSVEGQKLFDSVKRAPLLYYPSDRGLVATTTTAADPRAALMRYLSQQPEEGPGGLPADVKIVTYEHAPNGLLLVTLSYTSSVRALALEQPAHVRLALLGLIASLTEFPDVRAVQLDFEGRTRLGLGECSDLLGTPQERPALLNDERLLAS